MKIKKIISNQFKKDEKVQILNFFDKIYINFDVGNKNAHTIYLTQSIIDQVFAYIDSRNDNENVKIKFKKGNMDDLLRRFALNKFNNFNNLSKLNTEEQKIFDSVSEINDLYPNDLNNKNF